MRPDETLLGRHTLRVQRAVVVPDVLSIADVRRIARARLEADAARLGFTLAGPVEVELDYEPDSKTAAQVDPENEVAVLAWAYAGRDDQVAYAAEELLEEAESLLRPR